MEFLSQGDPDVGRCRLDESRETPFRVFAHAWLEIPTNFMKSVE